MAKKKEIPTEPQEPERVTDQRRKFDDLVVWQPAEGEPFQLGESVTWLGSGRHVDMPVVNLLRGMAGEIVSATYCNMFGDVTNLIVRFYADDRVIFVRAAVGELAYA